MKILVILSLCIFNSCTAFLPKIHNQSDNFIDVEVKKENFYMECSEIDKKESKSLMTFYAINQDIVHEFIFRRISETNWCEKKVKNSYKKLVKNESKVRLVGISPLEKKENNDLIKEPVPEKFKKTPYIVNWTFIRLETNKGCEAYFDTGCRPENYWGGLFPQK